MKVKVETKHPNKGNTHMRETERSAGMLPSAKYERVCKFETNAKKSMYLVRKKNPKTELCRLLRERNM